MLEGTFSHVMARLTSKVPAFQTLTDKAFVTSRMELSPDYQYILSGASLSCLGFSGFRSQLSFSSFQYFVLFCFIFQFCVYMCLTSIAVILFFVQRQFHMCRFAIL